jgi:nucleotide-binding universal stress UspA family protein
MSDMFIVVGVDEAWRRTGVLDWALAEARTRNLPLHALHVVPGLARHTPYDSETGDEVVPLEEAAAKLLGEVAGHIVAADGDLEFTTDILVGPPARRLTELSAFAQLLVVGRRGYGLLGRQMFGSTTDSVATYGEGNIIVVPDGWRPDERRDGPVVVGVDGRPESDAALDFAYDTARIRGVPLRMVHVWDVPSAFAWDPSTFGDIHDRSEAAAWGLLAELADRWQSKYPGVEVVRDARQAHRVLGLLDATSEAAAGLLVVGGRRHSQVANLLLGSVARRVLQHADCPVAVIHTRK